MSILTLKPIDVDNPPEGLVLDVSLRGIAIYWLASSEPAANRWQVQRVGFHAVSPTGEDISPRDADEQVRFVCAAYVLVACRHPIPSDAEVRYEVRW